MKTKFGSGILVGVLLMVCAIVTTYMGGTINSQNSFSNQEQIYECDGYDSPEEAALAYANAFSEKDYKAMVSTFAIETYIKNYNFAAMIDRVAVYQGITILEYPIENLDNMANSILKEKRLSTINNSILYQYAAVKGVREHLGDKYNQPIPVGEGKEYTSGKDFVSKVFNKTDLDSVSIIVKGTVTPSLLTDYYLKADNLAHISKMSNIYGTSDLTDIGVKLSIDGKEYLLCMTCGNYNGRWYNITCQGDLSQILGISADFGGLKVYSDIED